MVSLPHPSNRLKPVYLALVALLPLHTVFLRFEIAWKPWLILVIAIVAADLWLARTIPWPKRAAIGAFLFLATVLASWPGAEAGSTFWRLWLALLAGILLLLVTGFRHGHVDDILRVVFWSGAALAATAFVLALVTDGVFGERLVTGVNDIWLVDRVNKPAYLGSGFVAVTNWHQDPGYSALWTNVWLVLVLFAWTRGVIRAPRWVGPVVVGGLGAASILTYSRTGWLGMVVGVAASLILIRRDHGADVGRGIRVVLWGGLVALSLIAFQVAVDQTGVGGDVLASLEFRFAYITELGAIDLGSEGVIDPELIVADNRLDVWSEYWSRFKRSPLRGIGLGSGWGEQGLQEPHNLWLELLAETGVIGLLGFVVLLMSLGRIRSPMVGAVMAVILFASLTQTVLFEPVLWFGLGLWLASSLSESPSQPISAGTAI